MHIEKNIVDSIVGTLLDISGKTKNHVKARYVLKDIGIRKNLYPNYTEESKRTMFSKSMPLNDEWSEMNFLWSFTDNQAP